VTARLSPDRSGQAPQGATYVYCLVQSGKPLSTRGVPASVPGAGVPRLVAIDGDVWAVVADAPLERFAGEALQQELQDVEAISRHALAHAAVIEFFFRRAPVIPLKLFTLFSSDEKVRVHVRSRLAPLKRMFAGLRGVEEWGVRIVAGEAEAEAARTLESGRDYLQVKKRLHEQTLAPSRTTMRAANGALRLLGRLASKTRKEAFPPPGRGRPYVTGASFLVKAKRREAWKRQAAKLGARLAAEGHRLEMNGPWPPYHFVSK
jgi:Gas vesicle synthesis protein GvpL/GvpF